ncbi:MAG: DUF4870 domain-containing protein [Candidatus Omnitrophica bacterium]|nr:DUF4870 domain-containing protein [Candidatus Omnitrophota bacterium]
MADTKELGGTSTGLQANIAALLCYILFPISFVSGLIFFLLEKENKYVKFHAIQSMIVFGTLFLANIFLMFIPVLGWIVSLIISMLAFVLWIVLMVKAYQGECFKVPIAGDIAEKKSQA